MADPRTEELKAKLRAAYLEAAERVVCRRLDGMPALMLQMAEQARKAGQEVMYVNIETSEGKP
jgi:hypothetical protein